VYPHPAAELSGKFTCNDCPLDAPLQVIAKRTRSKEEAIMEHPYYLSARFLTKAKAGEAYFPLQQFLFEVKNECDLSVYRLKITEGWHIVVVGVKPSDAQHAHIEALLTKGTLVSLAHRPDVLRYLQSRRAEAIQLGPWVEAHYNHPPSQEEIDEY
jgi:hypothetical protein